MDLLSLLLLIVSQVASKKRIEKKKRYPNQPIKFSLFGTPIMRRKRRSITATSQHRINPKYE